MIKSRLNPFRRLGMGLKQQSVLQAIRIHFNGHIGLIVGQ